MDDSFLVAFVPKFRKILKLPEKGPRTPPIEITSANKRSAIMEAIYCTLCRKQLQSFHFHINPHHCNKQPNKNQSFDYLPEVIVWASKESLTEYELRKDSYVYYSVDIEALWKDTRNTLKIFAKCSAWIGWAVQENESNGYVIIVLVSFSLKGRQCGGSYESNVRCKMWGKMPLTSCKVITWNKGKQLQLKKATLS